MTVSFDITPSPRVLRMLGQIDFKPWQCLAELIDNSIDAFLEGRQTAMILRPEIKVTFPSSSQIKNGIGSIKISDNGIGMSSDSLGKSVKAGFSGNDPIEKLGLFGMGFNIATARLGRRTEVWTISPQDSNWTGVVIDFDELEKQGRFQAPRLTKPRGINDSHKHGTEITISKLNVDHVRRLIMGRGKSSLMQKLGKIYGKLIADVELEIVIDDEIVRPWRHCVWDKSRHVETSLGPVAAVVDINTELPKRKYCTTCWLWLQDNDTTCPACGQSDSIKERKRKVTGWLGIQRFFDQSHFGIDLIRNGRVIEELDKSLFYWENDSGDREMEYPIDTTFWGGRIVGEIEIDFVRVSHQKDSFDKTDRQWADVVDVIRGKGPLRPNLAKSLGIENHSILARLFMGYRTGRVAGLQYLVPGDANGTGINVGPKQWAEEYWAGNAEYQSDEKWWQAVLVAEEAKKKAKTAGGGKAGAAPTPPFDTTESTGSEEDNSHVKEPKSKYEIDDELSQLYELKEISGCPVLNVNVKRVVDGTLTDHQPVCFTVKGNSAEFVYDPDHEVFKKQLETPQNCLIRELAYQFLLRSNQNQVSWPITRVEQQLRITYFSESLIDIDELSSEADELLKEIREYLSECIQDTPPSTSQMITDIERDQIRKGMISEGQGSEESVSKLIKEGQFVKYLDYPFLLKAVQLWPDLLLDGKYFSIAYADVKKELQPGILERIRDMLRDVLWLYSESGIQKLNYNQWREQVLRSLSSLRLIKLWRS